MYSGLYLYAVISVIVPIILYCIHLLNDIEASPVPLDFASVPAVRKAFVLSTVRVAVMYPVQAVMDDDTTVKLFVLYV